MRRRMKRTRWLGNARDSSLRDCQSGRSSSSATSGREQLAVCAPSSNSAPKASCARPLNIWRARFSHGVKRYNRHSLEKDTRMSLKSLIACGTKIWSDSIDPDYIRKFRALGATGATSNPIIIADLIKTGRFDDLLTGFIEKGMKDDEIAW